MMLPSPVDYQVYHGGALALPAGKAYQYLLAGNGVFKYAVAPLLTALVPVAPARIAGLPELTPFARPAWRLPGRLLADLLEDARRVAWAAPREAMYHVHLSSETGRVGVRRPPQVATGAFCGYQGGGEADVLLDIHSHVEMGSSFSPTDNRDEQGFRLYGVLGRIFTRPEVRLRVGVYGDFWPLPVQAVFTGAGLLRDVYQEATWTSG